MSKSKNNLQHQKYHFAKKILNKSFDTATFILSRLAEANKFAIEQLPNSYPGFLLIKMAFGVYPKKKNQRISAQALSLQLYRLEKMGLVRKESSAPKKKVYALTEEGKDLISYIENRYKIINQKWDGRFRIVIFDVPEVKRVWRKWLRNELLLSEFKQLQKSVYIGKYPLPESFYKKILEENLNNNVFIFLIDKIDKEQVLRILDKD